MATTNFTDLDVTQLIIGTQEIHEPETAQTITGATGAITVKEGTCVLNRAGAIAATLANPTATTDDYKRLTILSVVAQTHTVSVAGGFGNGGANEVKASFSGVIGDCLSLLAYQGYWYVVGKHQITLGSA